MLLLRSILPILLLIVPLGVGLGGVEARGAEPALGCCCDPSTPADGSACGCCAGESELPAEEPCDDPPSCGCEAPAPLPPADPVPAAPGPEVHGTAAVSRSIATGPPRPRLVPLSRALTPPEPRARGGPARLAFTRAYRI